MKNKTEEEYLLHRGFKRKWLSDKSGSWLVKKFNINSFNCEFMYDNKFCGIYIQTYSDYPPYKKGNKEMIWKGTYNQLLKKIDFYAATRIS